MIKYFEFDKFLNYSNLQYKVILENKNINIVVKLLIYRSVFLVYFVLKKFLVRVIEY